MGKIRGLVYQPSQKLKFYQFEDYINAVEDYSQYRRCDSQSGHSGKSEYYACCKASCVNSSGRKSYK